MELQNVELFKGVTCASIDAMMSCFRPEVRKFKKGDTILVFEPEVKSLCSMWSAAVARRFMPCLSATQDGLMRSRKSLIRFLLNQEMYSKAIRS